MKKGESLSTTNPNKYSNDQSNSNLKFDIDDLSKRDLFGKSILHVIAITNDVKTLNIILKFLTDSNAHNLLLISDIENNWNLLHFAINNFNLTFVKTILTSNSPVLTKLLKHKDKNNLTPIDLLFTLNSTFTHSKYNVFSIDNYGNFKHEINEKGNKTNSSLSLYNASSIFTVLDNGETINCNIPATIFPQPSLNPLYHTKIHKFLTCQTHSVIITTTGHLYISNFQNTLTNSSFCRIKFFDDLFDKSDEYVIDASLTSNHTVVLTNKSKVYAFGTNLKRLSLYYLASTFDSFSKNLNTLIPISVTLKSKNQSAPMSSSSSNNSTSVNNFNYLSLLNSSKSLQNNETLNTLKIKGLTTSNNHTIIYTTTSFYIQGCNLGQFGPVSNSLIINSSVNSGTKTNEESVISTSFARVDWKYTNDPIKQMLALDLASLILTDSSTIHVYLSGIHLEITLPTRINLKDNWNQFKPRLLSKPKNIVKMVAPTNLSALKLDCSTYSIFLLVETGDIFILSFPKYATSKDSFNESVKFKNIWKPTRDEMCAIDVSIDCLDATNTNNLGTGTVICTKNGECFRKTKTKWTRIKNINKVANVSVGFGFPYSNNSNSSLNSNKSSQIVLIRHENTSLMHEISASSIFKQFGRLSPLINQNSKFSGIENSKKEEKITNDMHFFKTENMKYTTFNNEAELDHNIQYGEEEEFENGEPNNSDNESLLKGCISFDKKNKALEFSSNIRNKLKSLDSFYDFMISINEKDDFNLFKFNKFPDYNLLIKDYDEKIEINLPLNKNFIFERLSMGALPFSLQRKDLSCEFNEIDAIIEGSIDIRSVAIFFHYLYTDEILDIWNDVEYNSADNAQIHKVKKDFDRLIYNLPKPINLQHTIKKIYNNSNDILSDVTIKLLDGEIKSYKYLLSCRSEYFSQLFQSSWNDNSIIHFGSVSMYTWQLIMKYLSGYTTDSLFFDTIRELCKSAQKKINEKMIKKHKLILPVVPPFSSSLATDSCSIPKNLETYEDFINVVLEVLYLSDELLLDDLKEICELAIKDLINFDNYDILIQHAYRSRSFQLFSNCVWFIFHNLSIIYFDNRLSITNLGAKCMSLIETKIQELVKIYLPGRIINFQKPKIRTTKIHNNKILRSIDNIENHELKIDDINLFINNIAKYNEYYFHPILYEQIGPFYLEEDAQKHTYTNLEKARRKSSFIDSKSYLQSRSNSERQSFSYNDIFNTRAMLNKSIDDLTDESAIEDDINNGFTIIQKGRRKSSSVNNSSTSLNIRNSSISSVKNSFDILMNKRKESFNEPWQNMKKDFSFNERANGEVNNLKENIPISTFDEDLLLNNKKKPDTKIKGKSIIPMKLSQKAKKQLEREKQEKEKEEKLKKKLQENDDNKRSSSWGVSNAWGLNTPVVIEGSSKSGYDEIEKKALNTASIIAPNKLNSVNFPSLQEVELLKTKKEKKQYLMQNDDIFNLSNNNNRGMNIIPSTNLDELNKSLEEIQAEEEFERWWEEESKRVQETMKRENDELTSEKKGRGGGKGKGNRGGRGRGRGRGRGNGRGRGRRTSGFTENREEGV